MDTINNQNCVHNTHGIRRTFASRGEGRKRMPLRREEKNASESLSRLYPQKTITENAG